MNPIDKYAAKYNLTEPRTDVPELPREEKIRALSELISRVETCPIMYQSDYDMLQEMRRHLALLLQMPLW